MKLTFLLFLEARGNHWSFFRAQKYAMWFDEMYLKYYIPGHVNMGCYIAGLITGTFYNKIKKNNIDLTRYRV